MKQYLFTDAERAALEARCLEVASSKPGAPKYFIGQTADSKGSGFAMCEVVKGQIVRHWGDADELHAMLNDAEPAKAANGAGGSDTPLTAPKRTRTRTKVVKVAKAAKRKHGK